MLVYTERSQGQDVMSSETGLSAGNGHLVTTERVFIVFQNLVSCPAVYIDKVIIVN